ncbi:hypothetical protein SAMN05660477_02790 [Soonwooa buanensis]|uniref:HNH endonuclease n=1 Tax=Soonwooa buanensis TaxID=619805 RepID=A0A1T5GEG6_9FLAO|nr:hypothetical protein [Soonwooa buanensis]SKC06824.1 hypothetical protein SAMN05660477_02790 [Soonwooa buanensis]
MRKVKYPYNNQSEKDTFNTLYYNLIKDRIDESGINVILKKINNSYNLEKLIVSNFSELLEIQEKIKQSAHLKNLEVFFKFKKKKETIYLYDKFQPFISNFFMAEKIDLNSCHYCNIDFINTFEEHYQFNSKKEFISKAPKEILTMIDVISEKTANEIIKKRTSNNIINELKPILGVQVYTKLFNWWNSSAMSNSSKVDLKNIVVKKNHYTLDHVLPKNEFSFFSLSLYNLVPSCSSCNSKFKHMKEFTVNKDLSKICPTSEEFLSENLIEFKLNFDVNDPDFESKIKKIKQIDDVEVKIKNMQSLEGVDEFIEIFKIKSRYEFHKNISFDLIKKREKYSDSQLDELEKIFLKERIFIDKDTFKKHIFGSAIFEKENMNKPFEKYKKDIAKQLGLIP